MSDTPRSDEEEDVCRDCRVRFVSVSFAQELERELAQMTRERDEARDEALEHCIDVCNVHASDNGTAQKIANDINGWRIAGRKDASWEHLKPYGYAPGNYMSTCHKCGDTPTMDKRANTCRPCAEAMHAEKIAGRKA